MTIASEITKLNTNLTNSYTACQSKGATMPANQNFDNLATCINSIQTGGGGGGDWTVITSDNFSFYDSNGYFSFSGGTIQQSDYTNTNIKLVFDNVGYLKYAFFCTEDSISGYVPYLTDGNPDNRYISVGIAIDFSEGYTIDIEGGLFHMIGHTQDGDDVGYSIDVYWTAP